MTTPVNSASDSIYTYIIDSFVVPTGATHMTDALKFVQAAATPTAIGNLIRVKQSNSPRTDLDPTTMDPVALQSLGEMTSAALLNAQITPASEKFALVFIPDSPTAQLGDFIMLDFVKQYKDGTCLPAACKATFIAKFKALWPTVVAVAR